MSLTEVLKRFVPLPLYPSAFLRRAVIRKTGRRVVGGPFAGMQFVDRATWGAYLPKLIGTYELELHEVIERAIQRGPRQVIDIGGAEGYYAVGFLRRLPQATLVVFEQQASARQELTRLADMNGVQDRLSIRESCDPDALAAVLAANPSALVICDVEGYEVELLDPARVPALASTDLLVEVHDSRVAGCRDLIAARFSATHRVTAIGQRRRQLTDYPLRHPMAQLWPAAIIKYGLNEFRSPQNSWLYLERLETD
jgi:hypothetical protein